ncbi:hypothetical protein ACSV9I_16240 [Rhizobium sp. G187]|uniref:hypothetical protein n=1 Tax=Rhizobium sp. G187 TaxID=3451352 RepID=UPI003EE70C05
MLSPSEQWGLAVATRNMLVDCGGLAPESDILVCQEPAVFGWYEEGLARAVVDEAERQGFKCRLLQVGAPELNQTDAVAAELLAAENIVYFARIGDHNRFGTVGNRKCGIVVYARTISDFTSLFGRTNHEEMVGLKRWVDRQLTQAELIEITCPSGTEMRGRVPLSKRLEMPPDTSIRRFPLGVPAPVPADEFYGRVALCGALTPTGNSSYKPAVLPLADKIIAIVEAGRIVDFQGCAVAIENIRRHYIEVARKFDIEPFVVHSWHAGIHPAGPFFEWSGMDADYWSNTVFCNPRLLHFHTCGKFAPGEISWNVVDATVTVDGRSLWEAGRLRAISADKADDITKV